MKFIVNSTSLLKRLTYLNGIISSNPLVPILENFLFEISNKVLTLTSSDMQTYLITTLEVESNDNVQIAIPAKMLIDTLKNLSNQPITFTIDEYSYNIEITSNNGRYKLIGESAEDFPKNPTIEDPIAFKVLANDLKLGIKKTLFAISNDDARPAMSGIYVFTNNDGAVFVATDGHKLSKFFDKKIKSDRKFGMIIPKKPLTVLLNLNITNEDDQFEIEAGESFVSFKYDNFYISSRIIDEVFPEYDNVLPKKSPFELIIDKATLLSSIKRVAIYSNKVENYIKLKISGSELQVVAEDNDFSNEAIERLTCNYCGENIELGFNAKYLIEGLQNIDTDEVLIKFSQPHRPFLLYPVGESKTTELTVLVMPISLKEPISV